MSESILMFFQDISSPFLDLLMNGITILGEQLVFIVIITYLIWNVSKRTGYMITYTLMTSSLLNGLLKLAVHSPRPFQVIEGVDGKRLATAEGYAFPSGHTQGATTFYTSVAIFLKKRRFMAAAIIISLLVAVSRLYLGVHWPIDVIGGFTLGLLFTIFMISLLEKIYDDEQKMQRLNLISGLVSAVVLLILVPLASSESVHVEQYHSLVKLFALTGGLTIGSYFERRLVNYSVEGTLQVKLLRFAIGLIGALFFLFGLKYILPDHEVTTVLRYGGGSLWAFYLYPLIGVRIKLGKSGMTLFSQE